MEGAYRRGEEYRLLAHELNDRGIRLPQDVMLLALGQSGWSHGKALALVLAQGGKGEGDASSEPCPVM
jgi:hypothetical protein